MCKGKVSIREKRKIKKNKKIFFLKNKKKKKIKINKFLKIKKIL